MDSFKKPPLFLPGIERSGAMRLPSIRRSFLQVTCGILLALAGLLLWGGCSGDKGTSSVSGDVTETGNAFIRGKITSQGGQAVPGVTVSLLPEDYNPVADVGMVTLYAGITDSQGEYTIDTVDTGTYSIVAYYQGHRHGAWVQGIKAVQDDTTNAEPGTLAATGSIVQALDTTFAFKELGYIYIPGTPVYTMLDSSALKAKRAVLEHVLGAFVPEIHYNHAGAPLDIDSVISSDVQINPGDSVVCPGPQCRSGW